MCYAGVFLLLYQLCSIQECCNNPKTILQTVIRQQYPFSLKTKAMIFFLLFKATNLQDELDILKSKSENALSVMDEVEDLRQRLSKIQNDFNISVSENERLADELTRQQALYTELKKMRGRGEEMDMLQQLEQVSVDCSDCYSKNAKIVLCKLKISRPKFIIKFKRQLNIHILGGRPIYVIKYGTRMLNKIFAFFKNI